MTATSSSCLALKAMPERQRSDGCQTVRIAIPSRIAMHQRFDIGVGEDALFDQLGAKRNGGDRAAKGDAGNEGQAAADRARARLYPVRLVFLLRHMPPVLENSLCAGKLGFTNKFSISAG